MMYNHNVINKYQLGKHTHMSYIMNMLKCYQLIIYILIDALQSRQPYSHVILKNVACAQKISRIIININGFQNQYSILNRFNL